MANYLHFYCIYCHRKKDVYAVTSIGEARGGNAAPQALQEFGHLSAARLLPSGQSPDFGDGFPIYVDARSQIKSSGNFIHSLAGASTVDSDSIQSS